MGDSMTNKYKMKCVLKNFQKILVKILGILEV